MRFYQIITEAVDYMSLFNPLLSIMDSEEDKQETQKMVQAEIKKAKQKLSNLKGNQSWILYYLKYYRIYLATLIERNIKNPDENQDKIEKLRKIYYKHKNMMVNMTLSPHHVSRILDQLEHFTSYDYDPIKKYNPGDKPWNQVKKELEDLEAEYFDKIGDDERFLQLQEGDKIIKDFGDGVVWVMLNRGACREEADSMGHCGNVPSVESGDRIISLRKKRMVGSDTFYEPFLTFIYNQHTSKFGEMKGRSNDKPHPKYHPYIMWLISQDWVKGFGSGGYEPENNFSIDDLSKDQREKVIESNPFLALSAGIRLDSIPENVRDEIDLERSPGKHTQMWYNKDKNRIYLKIDADEVIDNHLLKFLEDPYMNFYDDYSRSKDAVNNMLSDLNDANMENLYESFKEVILDVDGLSENDVITFEEFDQKVSRQNFFDIFEEYLDENDDVIDFESETDKYMELIDSLESISDAASLHAYEASISDAVFKNLPEFTIDTITSTDIEFNPVGTMSASEHDTVYDFMIHDVEYIIYETTQYIDYDVDDIDHHISEALYDVRKVEVGDRYIDTSISAKEINVLFNDFFNF